MKVAELLDRLSKTRKVFHSEADFQHALAWLIHLRNPDARIRLERNLNTGDRREYLDLYVELAGKKYAFELKYKTRKLDLRTGDEEYRLLNQSAQDIGRYDFIKDVVRLERFVGANSTASGYAIILTNDSTYWTESKRLSSVDNAFRLHEARTLTGELQWVGASAGTMKGREAALGLRNEYPLNWHDYSRVTEQPGGRFRFLLAEVGNKSAAKPSKGRLLRMVQKVDIVCHLCHFTPKQIIP